ncbi:MAG: PQQ-binding-like beta-propeller repeat protein [Spirochaetaceae bacterium]|nr:PQQ-binding-like beta-propeller repeat protein [Spirochaetaceae bacterium]
MRKKLSAVVLFGTLTLAGAQPGPAWRQSLGGAAVSEISAQLGAIVAVCEGGSVKAFGSSGNAFWDFKENGRFLPFLARSGSAASYVCKSNGEFIALNRAGAVQWRVNLKEPIVAPPVSGWDERVFIFLDKKILCWTASGHRLWQKELAAPFASDPLLNAEGGITALLDNNTLLNITAFGTVNEIKLYSTPAFALPVSASRSHGKFRGIRTLVLYGDGRLELYGPEGEAQGNLTHLGAAPIAAASMQDAAAIQLASGNLVLLNAASGETLWKTASRPGAGVAGNKAQKIRIQFDRQLNTIYVLSVSGAACFSKNGEERWNVRLENAAVTPGFDDGVLYSSGKDWLLYAYKTEDRPKPREAAISLPPAGYYGLGEPPGSREWNDFTLAYGGGYDSLLKQIGATIRSGSIGEDEPLLARILIGIARDSKIIQTERIEAVKMLGLIGSRETIPFLSGLVFKETASSVQTEIVLSLGRIGCDPRGRVLDTLSKIIELNRPVQSETLMTAIAAALGNMCRFSGPPVSERGIRLLVTIANEPSSSIVQQRARRELDRLAR